MRIFIAALLTTFCLSAAAQATAELDPAPPPSATWKEVYELSLDDGSLLVRGVNVGGQTIDAAIDTGCSDIILPYSISSKLNFDRLSSTPALDYSGVAHDYPTGNIRTRRLGATRETTESAIAMPDEQLDGQAILPFGLLQADLICFLCSEGRLLLCDDAAAWDTPTPAADASSATGGMHYLPYWENLAGIFLGVEIDGVRCLALVDTGASCTSIDAGFIAEHPATFSATGETVEFIGIHGEGTTEPVYATLAPLKLLSVDGESDLEFTGAVTARPAYTNAGTPAGPGDYGGDCLPYLDLPSPNPWPVAMVIGMDILSQCDFAFDTRMKLLTVMQPGGANPGSPR